MQLKRTKCYFNTTTVLKEDTGQGVRLVYLEQRRTKHSESNSNSLLPSNEIDRPRLVNVGQDTDEECVAICFYRRIAEQMLWPGSTRAKETAVSSLHRLKAGWVEEIVLGTACDLTSPVVWKCQYRPRSTSPSAPLRNHCGPHLRNRWLHLFLRDIQMKF